VGRTATWLACGGVAAGVAGVGALLDGLLRSGSLFLALSLVVGIAYLYGTFSQNTRLFGGVVRTRADRPELALTFDDGPDPRYTPEISALLAERDHRATFFVLGAHVRTHPHLVAQLAADGHEVASHGNAHGLLAFSSPSDLRKQLGATARAVEEALGKPPAPLFRPPHGVRSPWLVGVARRYGYEVCGWDGRVFDTAAPGVEKIVARVQRLLRPGAVVLLHDGDGSGRAASREETLAALGPILDELHRRGLRSVPLSELARDRTVRQLTLRPRAPGPTRRAIVSRRSPDEKPTGGVPPRG
jgi:peptidoglycan/xylan/chitin deacetylase (PgdA/CDA1 family)